MVPEQPSPLVDPVGVGLQDVGRSISRKSAGEVISNPSNEVNVVNSTAKYRVGVIGAGLKGTQHARAYQLDPRTEVVAVAESDPEVRELFRERFGLERGFTDCRGMLANEDIDIAAPILPSVVNPEVVFECIRVDVKGIFCEKPMCVSLDEADRMVAECKSRGITLASGDSERNYDSLWKVRDIIETGELGNTRSITIHGGGGEMWGGGCQSLSVMRMFAWDADVDWVTGWVAGDPWSEHDQGMGGYIRFTNDIECIIHLDPGVRQGIEVVCDDGLCTYDWRQVRLFKGKTLADFGGPFPANKGWGPGLDEDGWISMATRQDNSTRSFVDALEAGVEPRTSGDNMRKVLEIILALRESHRRNHAAVKLPLEDRSLGIVPVSARAYGQRSVGSTDWYWPALMSQKPA